MKYYLQGTWQKKGESEPNKFGGFFLKYKEKSESLD